MAAKLESRKEASKKKADEQVNAVARMPEGRADQPSTTMDSGEFYEKPWRHLLGGRQHLPLVVPDMLS